MNTPDISSALGTYSLAQLQAFNERVYRPVNGRHFELHDMVCRMQRFAARVAYGARGKQTQGVDRTGYYLCMMLSWLCAIANRLFPMDIQHEVFATCNVSLPECASTLADVQRFFATRHADVTSKDAALCLTQKVLGIASALEYQRETHGEAHFQEMIKKMAESVEAICVFASKLEINLNETFEFHFFEGCVGCRSIPCHCEFRADKVV